jgi:hypothetical protein
VFARFRWYTGFFMMLTANVQPPKGWRAVLVTFSSLKAALEINRQIEKDFDHATCFRWRAVLGSTKVIGEFWFPGDAGAIQ